MNNTPNEFSNDHCDDQKSPQKEKHSFLAALVENLEVIVVAVSAVLILFTLGFRLCSVNGTSMNKTLNHEDRLIVSNIGYTPSRGDIIVFHMTTDDPHSSFLNEPMVKRVIATSGEWIDIDFNTWTVRIADNPEMNNAITLEEPYRYLDPSKKVTSSYSYPLEVPEGYIFVMVDNRNGSLDSRDSRIGLVDTRRVLGKVVCRVYPFEKIEN